MIGQSRLIHRSGIVVESSRYLEIYREILLRDSEGSEILGHLNELVESFIENGAHASVLLECGYDLGVRALYCHEIQQGFRLAGQHLDIVYKNLFNLLCSDLVQLVDRAHYLRGFLGHAADLIKAVQELSVVHSDREPVYAELCKSPVYYGGDLRLVQYIKLPVTDDIYVGLIEFPESASLGSLSAVYLADLIASERERELRTVLRHIPGQRHGEIKAER